MAVIAVGLVWMVGTVWFSWVNVTLRYAGQESSASPAKTPLRCGGFAYFSVTVILIGSLFSSLTRRPSLSESVYFTLIL
jgi:hypothetical protein